MFEFCNNEEVKQLFVYSSSSPGGGGGMTASLAAPHTLREKAMYFLKAHTTTKVTRDNVSDSVAYCDCSNKPLEHISMLTREVYLPLLSIDMGGSVSADKLMDLVHRLVANMQAAEGYTKVSAWQLLSQDLKGCYS